VPTQLKEEQRRGAIGACRRVLNVVSDTEEGG
jgi:hypothetical protein